MSSKMYQNRAAKKRKNNQRVRISLIKSALLPEKLRVNVQYERQALKKTVFFSPPIFVWQLKIRKIRSFPSSPLYGRTNEPKGKSLPDSPFGAVSNSPLWKKFSSVKSTLHKRTRQKSRWFLTHSKSSVSFVRRYLLGSGCSHLQLPPVGWLMSLWCVQPGGPQAPTLQCLRAGWIHG